MCIRKNYKKWNPPVAIFHEIWPKTIVQGLWPDFGSNLKIRKNSNFDQNQFKIEKQHKDMYMYQEKLLKKWNSTVAIFHEIWPITMYYSTGTLARFWSKFKNS